MKTVTEHVESVVFHPHYPEGVEQMTPYKVLCDDKGRNGTVWLSVLVSKDGDVHVGMFDQENPDSTPDPEPTIRVRTYGGGGRNMRTHQALLWLARAIQLDNKEHER
jgi:hypothetical protein